MQKFLLVTSFAFLVSCCYGQHKINETGKLLFAIDDTVLYVYKPLKGNGFQIPFSIKDISSEPGKLVMLNNENRGWPGKHVYKTAGDSIVLQSDKEASFLMKATNGKDTVALYANFVNVFPNYTPLYIKENTGKATYEIPQPFELANIVLALTDTGSADDNLVRKGTKYHNDVINYFKAHKNHPVVAYVDSQFAHHDKFSVYYDARNHTLGYDMLDNAINPGSIYPERWGQNFWTGQTALLQDFAEKSDFAGFYKAHQSYYDSLINLERRYMPVHKMWRWLEKEFPAKYDAYKVIFSPLIGGAHNTEKYSANGFNEVLMYVASIEQMPAQKPAIVEGLMSAMVFTEIDHNYVNPMSDAYKKEIEAIFSDRKKWTGSDGDAVNYGSAYTVFNEYMTHGLFCLYASLHYAPADFKFVNARREELMISKRKFIKFKAFNDHLREMYMSKGRDEKVADLYPKILKWAKTVE